MRGGSALFLRVIFFHCKYCFFFLLFHLCLPPSSALFFLRLCRRCFAVVRSPGGLSRGPGSLGGDTPPPRAIFSPRTPGRERTGQKGREGRMRIRCTIRSRNLYRQTRLRLVCGVLLAAGAGRPTAVIPPPSLGCVHGEAEEMGWALAGVFVVRASS